MMTNYAKCVLILLTACGLVATQDLMCCSHATGSCRTFCEEISLVEIAADVAVRNQTLLDVHKVCSAQLVQFWDCLNATFDEMARGDSWSGRVCCSHTHSESCRRACITATRTADLDQGCRKSDEISFFMCVDQQGQGEDCCGQASTTDCRNACTDIFRSRLTPTRQQRILLADSCELASPEVLNCVGNFVRVTPVPNSSKYTACCEESNKSRCREACRSALASNNTLQEMLDIMQVGGCGPPLLHDPLFQCFMQPMVDGPQTVKVSRIDRVGMDSAKLHCCQKASTSMCRKLCSKTFTKDWSMLWDEFHYKCQSDVAQEDLRNCIDEVDEPCELGCDGLSFCTNFNNRPTELFRSCTPQADEAARNDVELWQSQRELTLPGLTLPLKNISSCSPNTWKAVACTLQIKPCSRHSHANQICRNICLEILSQCVDWTQTSLTHPPESICATLSPADPDMSCVSLERFLAPSDQMYSHMEGQVSSPCKGDPCEVNETCTANKNCKPGESCLPYKCTPGCRMGEVSEYVVPEGAYVRIPIPNNRGCLKICKCTRSGIDQCQPLPCVNLSGCWMGSSNQRQHGEAFDVDCNKCSCYAGEVICSKKQCRRTALEGVNTAYTTLPCNCPTHYVPVCGRNGMIYPSACLAKCAGLSDSEIDYGPCQDPCRSNPCAVGKKCVPDTKVCLSLMHKPCTQYQCINGTTQCGNLSHDPVCDTDNREHANSCLLAHSNKKLAYRGACIANCKYQGEVCGFNGKTYISECAARADYALVDYAGPCVTVGLISDRKTVQCANIRCASLPHEHCMGLTPPGACCPICGGMLRLIYSKKQIDRALYALQSKSTYALTLRAMLRSLARHIQVAQCSLTGYLTMELDIFVAVTSDEHRASELQLEACVREAEKLASLINRSSPRVASELSLSSLIFANVVHVPYSSAAHVIDSFRWLLPLVALTFIFR